MYLVVEYVKNGDLTNILKSRAQSCAPGELPTLTDGEIWNIFRQLAAGVRYLHYQNVVHGDIKPQNLLIGEDGVVKIADFGISKMVHASSQKLADAAGTPAFMSPELCSGGSFSGQLADVWAMGITIFMLKFGQPPFIAGNIILLYHKIQSDPLVFPSAINHSLQELLVGMLQKDPEERCQLNEVIQHSWLRQPPVIRVQNQAPAQNFKPPDSYDRDERAAMEGPVHTVNNEDIYSSIAFGTRSKQKIKADQLMASAENEDIMATNWGDDVFEHVSDGGFDSDSEDDEDVSSSLRKFTDFSTATTNSNSKVMPDFEINERENRFRNSSMHKIKAIEPTIDITAAQRKPGEVEDANDATEVSMDDFEKMMDTLALQPLRSRDTNTFIDKKSLDWLQEDEDEFDDIRRKCDDGKFEVISQYQNRRNGVAAAFHSEQGQRKGQEDRCLLATSAAKIKAVENSGAPPEVFEVLSNFTIAGVFDGHNGAKCAQCVCQNLPPQLVLHKKFLGKPNELEVALKESFGAVDEAVCASLKEKGDNSGSTGLIAVYDGRYIYEFATVLFTKLKKYIFKKER
jgi:serine/threonine protein kinase